jgi:hypothetical protein
MKWACVLAVASLSVACGGTSADTSASPDAEAPEAVTAAAPAARPGASSRPPAAAAVRREVTVPTGTALNLDLTTPVASATSQVEDTVRATLRESVSVDGRTVLPAGAELVGTVTDVERSGRVKGRARVAYSFTRLRHGAESYDIRTAPVIHEAEATKSEDATKIGIGAGAGAVIGGILGGGDGAAKGAAIGGAAGTGTVLATRGKEVEIAAGANVTTSLAAPVTIRAKG